MENLNVKIIYLNTGYCGKHFSIRIFCEGTCIILCTCVKHSKMNVVSIIITIWIYYSGEWAKERHILNIIDFLFICSPLGFDKSIDNFKMYLCLSRLCLSIKFMISYRIFRLKMSSYKIFICPLFTFQFSHLIYILKPS